MILTSPVTIAICIATVLVSLRAFGDSTLRERLIFRPHSILVGKEWHRLVSSALIHFDWMHLGFNLIAFLSFGSLLERVYGWNNLLFVYGLSIVGGSLLSLYLHRHEDYAALGASGGVCGVIFATIFLIPGTGVAMFFIPIAIPGPVFAVLYLVGTFVALRKGGGNIGHDAHFGGATVGLLLALLIQPQVLLRSPVFFGLCLACCVGCLYVLHRDPSGIGLDLLWRGKRREGSTIRYKRYDEAREDRIRKEKLNRILDKISRKGIGCLSRKERSFLEQYAETRRRSVWPF